MANDVKGIAEATPEDHTAERVAEDRAENGGAAVLVDGGRNSHDAGSGCFERSPVTPGAGLPDGEKSSSSAGRGNQSLADAAG